jgi:hypothetical protein
MDPTAYGSVNLVAAFWESVLWDLRSRSLKTRVRTVAWLYSADFEWWANISGYPPEDVRAAMLRRASESLDSHRGVPYTVRRRDTMRCGA